VVLCPSCGTENPERARFCLECGTPIVASTSASRERKFATALFADVVGSTALTEREDPEVVQAAIARTFDHQAAEIERYGGFLEKFMGDGLLAVFGVPTAHEDDPERAVRAALQLHHVTAALNRSFAAEGKPELAIRIGIEAGEVLVDLERVAGSRDRMLTGDAVNTAARLQALAAPGTVVVGPSVFAATKDAVEYRELAPLQLKGKSEPVPAWVATGMLASRAGERAQLGLEARLVGRDEELALLTGSLRRVASERRPALITVLGAAGVGKSRLARELRNSLAEGSETWLTGRCLPYGNVSYSALADAVKMTCGILDDDAPSEVSAKVASVAERLTGDRELAPQLEILVAGAADRAFGREDLFDAWRRFLESIAAPKPLVLVIEDAHWADEGLLDFLEHLADWAQERVTILVLSRPELLERRPAWGGGKRNATALYLDALTPSETEAMLDDLLATRLPDDLRQLIVERSDGNPLFSEEIVRMLIDRGILDATGGTWKVEGTVDRDQIPRSVQGLIASRIDSLPDLEKAIVQNASVVGRYFWLGAVAMLTRITQEEARDPLHGLLAKEVIVPRTSTTFSGELEFAFKHVLIRDVAYQSLPKSFRADKHVAVGRWAEEQAAQRSEDVAELLATHYTRALDLLEELGETGFGDVERDACRWARVAGERALRLWQQSDALRWFRTAADLSERIGLPDGERAAIRESFARASEGVEPYPVVEGAFQRALALYDAIGSDGDSGRVEAALALVAFRSGDEEGVLRWGGLALDHLEPIGESRDLAVALEHLGWYYRRKGLFADAEPYLRRAVSIADRCGDPIVQGRAMLSLGSLLYRAGRMDEGLALHDQALKLARGVGDLDLLLSSLLVASEGLEESAGDYAGAVALLREGLDLARRAGHTQKLAWMLGNLSDYMVDLGRLDEVEELAREGLEVARSVGEVPRIGFSLVTLSYNHALKRELDEAERLLAELRDLMAGSAESYHLGWEPLLAGCLARGRGREDEATAVFLEGAERVGDRLELWGGQNLLLESARALERAGRTDEADLSLARLSSLAETSVPARAFLAWANGLLGHDHALLSDAAARFETLGRRVEQGRVLLDLGELAADPTTAARGRHLLAACGALLFLPEHATLQASGPGP
jgi:class 3 adenylate cyclase/tetratricopeptide (TPR) repeat protein